MALKFHNPGCNCCGGSCDCNTYFPADLGSSGITGVDTELNASVVGTVNLSANSGSDVGGNTCRYFFYSNKCDTSDWYIRLLGPATGQCTFGNETDYGVFYVPTATTSAPGICDGLPAPIGTRFEGAYTAAEIQAFCQPDNSILWWARAAASYTVRYRTGIDEGGCPTTGAWLPPSNSDLLALGFSIVGSTATKTTGTFESGLYRVETIETTSFGRLISWGSWFYGPTAASLVGQSDTFSPTINPMSATLEWAVV